MFDVQWDRDHDEFWRMKKILAILALCPAISWGWGDGSGGSVDYSRDAGNTYICANPAGTSVTTQAGLSVTTPALTLVNPWGSGKNLVILDIGISVTASPAAAAQFMVALSSTSSVTNTTQVGMIPALLGVAVSSKTASSPVALCDRVSTLPFVPFAVRYLGGTTGASGIGGVVLTDQTNGKLVVPPGNSISIQSTSAAAIITHITEREDNL